MKIGFAGRWDPRDKKSWSGTYYYSYQQLKKNHELDIFAFDWTWAVREKLMLRRAMNKLFYKKNTAVEFLKGYARYFSKKLEQEMIQHKLDLIYAPAAPQLIAYLETNVPVIFMTDATFKQIQGYYDAWKNFAPSNIREGIEVDARAFKHASHNLLASYWCKDSAIKDYGIPADNITVAPLGANLDEPPLFSKGKMKDGVCRLLFLGVEWERKGGAIALEAFRRLKQMGQAATLHIVGCVPPVALPDEGITVIPYLDKHKPEELKQLQLLIEQSHFLILPTRAEAAGLVFCEASAYGTPTLSTDTGGVPTYVRNGLNGYTLSLEATGEDYANKISDLFQDFDAYQSLSLSSRKLYEEELNWDRWGEHFHTAADKVLGKG